MITKNVATAILLFIFAAISVYIGHWASDAAYYLGAQFNECLLLLLLSINTQGIAKTFATTLLILATFELIDEIAGRNTSFFTNDYVPVITAIIFLAWKLSKKKY